MYYLFEYGYLKLADSQEALEKPGEHDYQAAPVQTLEEIEVQYCLVLTPKNGLQIRLHFDSEKEMQQALQLIKRAKKGELHKGSITHLV